MADEGPDDGPIGRQALEYIRFVLASLGMTPRQLALNAGLAPSTITRPLTDPKHRYTISTKTLGKIRDYSKIDPTPFFKVDAVGTARAAAVLASPEVYFIGQDAAAGDTSGLLDRTILTLSWVGYDIWRKTPNSASRLGTRPSFLPFASWDPNHFAFAVSDDHCDHIASAQFEFVICRQAPEQFRARDPDNGRGRPVVVQRINREKDLEELTVQRLFTDDVGRLILQFASNNPTIPSDPRFYDPQRELIIAYVDWVFRDATRADQVGMTPQARASNLQQTLQEREARRSAAQAETAAKIAELGGMEEYQAWKKDRDAVKEREAKERRRRRQQFMESGNKLAAKFAAKESEKKQK